MGFQWELSGLISGNYFRTLIWRYCTVPYYKTIFWGQIRLHRPIYGMHLQFIYLKWPLNGMFIRFIGISMGIYGFRLTVSCGKRSIQSFSSPICVSQIFFSPESTKISHISNVIPMVNQW